MKGAIIIPKSKTPIDDRIEKVKTEIRQSENRINQLLQRNSNIERNQRTRRLIERGAILESMIEEAEILTNEQIKMLLQMAFNSAAVREIAVAFRSENGEKHTTEAE